MTTGPTPARRGEQLDVFGRSEADRLLLLLYKWWSEVFYASSLMSPSEEIVAEFRAWLRMHDGGSDLAVTERQFLAEFARQQKER